MSKININQRCSVTLTEHGADWLNKHNAAKIEEYRKILEKLSASEDQISRIYPINNERGTVIDCLLWELMEMFGEYFSSYTDAPFISNNVHLMIPEC